MKHSLERKYYTYSEFNKEKRPCIKIVNNPLNKHESDVFNSKQSINPITPRISYNQKMKLVANLEKSVESQIKMFSPYFNGQKNELFVPLHEKFDPIVGDQEKFSYIYDGKNYNTISHRFYDAKEHNNIVRNAEVNKSENKNKKKAKIPNKNFETEKLQNKKRPKFSDMQNLKNSSAKQLKYNPYSDGSSKQGLSEKEFNSKNATKINSFKSEVITHYEKRNGNNEENIKPKEKVLDFYYDKFMKFPNPKEECKSLYSSKMSSKNENLSDLANKKNKNNIENRGNIIKNIFYGRKKVDYDQHATNKRTYLEEFSAKNNEIQQKKYEDMVNMRQRLQEFVSNKMASRPRDNLDKVKLQSQGDDFAFENYLTKDFYKEKAFNKVLVYEKIRNKLKTNENGRKEISDYYQMNNQLVHNFLKPAKK